MFEIERPRVFFEGDGTDSGAGDPAARRENPADVARRYDGDAVRLASDLATREHDNYTLREKNRDLRTENEALKGKVPSEGALVLSAEQAAQWQAWQALQMTPEQATAQLTAGKTATERAAHYERDGVKGTLDLAAEAENWPADVLKLFAKDLPVELREVDVTDAEGQTVKSHRPFVVGKDGDAEKLTPLREHFKAQGETVLNLLETGARADSQSHADNGSGANGRSYPAQGAGSGKPVEYKPRNRYAHNADSAQTAAA